MDQEGFDRLSRQVSAATSRRGALRALVAGGFAAGIAAAVPLAGSASQTVKGCRVPGQGCNSDKKCCSDKCKNKVCSCLERGKSCLVVVSPQLPPLPNKAICCSSKCSRKNRCL